MPAATGSGHARQVYGLGDAVCCLLIEHLALVHFDDHLHQIVCNSTVRLLATRHHLTPSDEPRHTGKSDRIPVDLYLKRLTADSLQQQASIKR